MYLTSLKIPAKIKEQKGETAYLGNILMKFEFSPTSHPTSKENRNRCK
jgi:hypothetical protein